VGVEEAGKRWPQARGRSSIKVCRWMFREQRGGMGDRGTGRVGRNEGANRLSLMGKGGCTQEKSGLYANKGRNKRGGNGARKKEEGEGIPFNQGMQGSTLSR